MFLLTDLTEKGYLHLKHEREDILRKIKNLQVLLDEFDLALPYLESIFQPKIRVYKDKRMGKYLATTIIPFNQDDRKRLVVPIGNFDQYKDETDPLLLSDARKKMRVKIMQEFPQHFRGVK